MTSALTRYRVLAYATGVFLLLLTLHVVIQIVQAQAPDVTYSQTEGLGTWIPGADVAVPAIHGYLYLAYVIVSLDLWFRSRRTSAPLNTPRMVLVVLAGTVPLMSFVAERWVTRNVRRAPVAVGSGG